MRSARFIAFTIFISITLYSCFRPDDFDDVPRIAFQSLEFKPAPGNIPDSLILTIDFQDGDGDLGLREDFNLPLVHEFDFIVDNNGTFVTLNGDGFALPFRRAFLLPDPGGQLRLVPADPDEVFSEVDNRPSEFDCQHYVVDSIESTWRVPFPPYSLEGSGVFGFDCSISGQPCSVQDTLLDNNGIAFLQTRIDTFYIAKNEQSRNIYVDFFRKRGGEYEFIDWTRIFDQQGCGTNFDARFPVLSEDRLESGKSLEGTIRYGMQSEGFELVLRADTFRIEVRILDGEFNVSNTVVSPDLTLNQIRG